MQRSCVARAVTLVLVVGSLACSATVGQVALISTKPTRLRPPTIKERVEGRDCAARLLVLVPMGSARPTIDAALADALAKVPKGNVMMNVTLDQSVIVTYLYNRTCLVVRGDVAEQQP